MNKDKDDDQLMDDMNEENELEFEQNEEIDFGGEDEIIIGEDEEEEDLIPSVLYKGISRPKSEDEWRQLLLEASRQGVPEYQLSDDYREGDLIQHPKFDLGVVSKVITPRKMEVVFKTDKKLMAKNVTAPEQD